MSAIRVSQLRDFPAGPETHAFHVLGGGNTFFKAGEIKLKDADKEQDHPAGHSKAAPLAVKDLQRLLHQHLGGKIADEGAHEHQSQDQQRCGKAPQREAIERGQQQIGNDQRRAEAETVLKDGLEDPDGDYVAGGLHPAAAVEQQGRS